MPAPKSKPGSGGSRGLIPLDRRTVGVGPAFPILGYDELTARQVGDRLAGLRPPELRKVRDYERRHANRKTVLEAIEKALSS